MKKKDFAAFQSSFLGKDDLVGPTLLVIKNVTEEEIQGDGGKEAKPVIHFTNHSKSMILNNINWDTIADAYGDDSDGWQGRQIEAYVDPSIMFGAKRVGGLRLRVPNGTTAKKQTPLASVPSNGAWGWEFAVSTAGAAGITKPDLQGRLKALGHTGWSPERDTPTLVKWIEEAANQEAATAPPTEESFA